WMALRYLDKLYEPLKTISKKAAGIQSYLASAERAFALLDEQPEVPERPHARTIGRAAGAVAFRHVSFAYGPDRPVLHDVSFEIEPGTRLGVVGATGAGKTTLISLLPASTTPSRERFCWTAWTCATTRFSTCGASSRSCSRTPCCFPFPSPKTSRTRPP